MNVFHKGNIEWIIINDNPRFSIDHKIILHSSLSIYIIDHQTNLGIHASRPDGLSKSSGIYILFLDQDDLTAKIYMDFNVGPQKGEDGI